ncbi:hypothetical protein BgiBS90_031206, partial [Biomphalaria glabrata]
APSVLKFTANGRRSINLNVGDNVTFYCQVMSTDPPSKAVLVGSGLGSIKEIISTNETLELSLSDLQCEDSGRYYCTGRKGFEDNVTSFPFFVDIYIYWPYRLNQLNNTYQGTTVSPDENTVFTVVIYGYTEPTEYVLKKETGKTNWTLGTN